ncbi:hypothetical protein BV898_09074 [Hypsibius exemplaris]|uniref:Uncharacterized protein n=1 Tax=Hypsibius exemplaris TaxID=2072580 RepID=A0A1W0WNX0_HYPEX|nr:hypothetical protein BV898_09074 [Hypsibius exemplaris]
MLGSSAVRYRSRCDSVDFQSTSTEEASKQKSPRRDVASNYEVDDGRRPSFLPFLSGISQTVQELRPRLALLLRGRNPAPAHYSGSQNPEMDDFTHNGQLFYKSES